MLSILAQSMRPSEIHDAANTGEYAAPHTTLLYYTLIGIILTVLPETYHPFQTHSHT